MEPFNIFETGGRQKFLKKKKDKKVKLQTQNKQLSNIIIIQKNIKRFIQLKRFYQSINNKIELQNQQTTYNLQSELFYYWLLTPYKIRAQSFQVKLIQFWCNPVFHQNQVYQKHMSLVRRMVSLSVNFLEELFKLNQKDAVRICRVIIKMYANGQIPIGQHEAKQIMRTLNVVNTNESLINIKVQLIDDLLSSAITETRDIGMRLLYNKNEFIEYVTLKGRQLQYEQIKQLVIACYPHILDDKSEVNYNENHDYFSSLCYAYNKVFRHLSVNNTINIQMNTQQKILIMCFLRDMTLQMKSYTIDEIIKKYKINPKIFDSQTQYRQYLEEKDEYLILREEIMGEYEKSKEFIRESIQLLISIKQEVSMEMEIMTSSIINNKKHLVMMYESGFEYIYQLLNMLGDVEVVSLDKAIKLFVDNINEIMIYGLGKDIGSSSTTTIKNIQHSSSIENRFLLLLTLIDKSAQQTPDLYFTKYYQSQLDKDTLKKLIKQYLLKILKHLMFLPYPTSITYKIINITTSILQNLYNKIFRTNLLPTEIFQNTSFVMKFKNYNFKTNTKDEITQFLVQFPYIFPLSMRADKFKDILRFDRARYNYRALHHDYNNDDYYYDRNVKIRRNHEFQDAFDQLRKRDLRESFRITFINQLGFEQVGVDAGGLKKEFLNRVLKDALNPKNGMFIQNSNHELLPHPTKAELNEGIYAEYYEFIGKLIGLAIYSNITLGYKFSGTFLNAIVGKKNCFDDLRTIDPSLYKGLIYIKDMKEDAKQLSLTFLYQDEARNKLIQLLPNGHLIPVTNENKRLYISLLTGYKVNRSLQHQTRFIRKGLTQIINKQCLFMFNYEQLNYLISGQGKIDADDLKFHTKVAGFEEGSPTIRYFWEVVKEFDEEQKSKLLMFVTACPRPSFLGFKQLSPPFTIICMKDKQHLLPISHTCSNVLQLPDYKDKQELKKKLLTAIESNAGFEFG